MAKPIGEFKKGDQVTLHGVVVGFDGSGAPKVWFPGVGETGRWGVNKNALAEPGGNEATQAFMDGIMDAKFEDGEESI